MTSGRNRASKRLFVGLFDSSQLKTGAKVEECGKAFKAGRFMKHLSVPRQINPGRDRTQR
jgi:hypothetical protein